MDMFDDFKRSLSESSGRVLWSQLACTHPPPRWQAQNSRNVAATTMPTQSLRAAPAATPCALATEEVAARYPTLRGDLPEHDPTIALAVAAESSLRTSRAGCGRTSPWG